jgi:hypothetical protein
LDRFIRLVEKGRLPLWPFHAVSHRSLILYHSQRGSADDLGGVSGASIGMLIAGAFLEYNRFVPILTPTR